MDQGSGVEAPPIPDNILSIGLRCWQETNSQGWQKPGMCYKKVVSHTPSENFSPHSCPSTPPSPSLWRMFLLGNWCKGAIDRKEWNIKPPHREVDRLGGVGGCTVQSNVLRTPPKGGLISLSSPSLFSRFLFSFPLTPPPSLLFPFLNMFPQLCVRVCAPSRPHKIFRKQAKGLTFTCSRRCISLPQIRQCDKEPRFGIKYSSYLWWN